MEPRVTFIVAVWKKTTSMWCQLASLADQTVPVEILVTEDGDDPAIMAEHQRAADQFGAKLIVTQAGMDSKAANMVWEQTRGEWLGFANDDGYMVPKYAELMIAAAEKHGWDLVYCDLVYDPRLTGKYDVLLAEPRLGRVDRTSFLVRRKVWEGFVPYGDNWLWADGATIEAMIKRGVAHGKAKGVLVVHN
jgi:hypothetical protein